jgi:homoserine kinase
VIEEQRRTLRVAVPATSANLGAGFDVLGLALDLHNVFTVTPAKRTTLEISGYADDLPADSSNLFCKAFNHLFGLAEREAPQLAIRMDLLVPPGKGLGSSATAVVGGLVAANTSMGGPLSGPELLREAIKLEHGGHADNVAPALLGGLVVNAFDNGNVVSLRVPVPAEIRAVLFTPDFAMDTVQGRALMPEHYTRADAVFSTSRVALFLAALAEQRYNLLKIAMQDRLHQPYRAQIFPLLDGLIESALNAGAHGACLSGGGSSVLGLVTTGADEVGAAMLNKAKAAGIMGDVRVLEIDRKGAQATWEEAIV